MILSEALYVQLQSVNFQRKDTLITTQEETEMKGSLL